MTAIFKLLQGFFFLLRRCGPRLGDQGVNVAFFVTVVPKLLQWFFFLQWSRLTVGASDGPVVAVAELDDEGAGANGLRDPVDGRHLPQLERRVRRPVALVRRLIAAVGLLLATLERRALLLALLLGRGLLRGGYRGLGYRLLAGYVAAVRGLAVVGRVRGGVRQDAGL